MLGLRIHFEVPFPRNGPNNNWAAKGGLPTTGGVLLPANQPRDIEPTLCHRSFMIYPGLVHALSGISRVYSEHMPDALSRYFVELLIRLRLQLAIRKRNIGPCKALTVIWRESCRGRILESSRIKLHLIDATLLPSFPSPLHWTHGNFPRQ